MKENDNKESVFAGLGIIAGIGICAFIGWIVGLVIWVIFSLFRPIDMAPPLIYQIAWAIAGVIGILFLKK